MLKEIFVSPVGNSFFYGDTFLKRGLIFYCLEWNCGSFELIFTIFFRGGLSYSGEDPRKLLKNIVIFLLKKEQEQWSKIYFRLKQRLQQCVSYNKRIFRVNDQMQTHVLGLSITLEQNRNSYSALNHGVSFHLLYHHFDFAAETLPIFCFWRFSKAAVKGCWRTAAQEFF